MSGKTETRTVITKYPTVFPENYKLFQHRIIFIIYLVLYKK
jgi:hypothetical protein